MSAVRNLITKFTKNAVNATDADAIAVPSLHEKSPDDDEPNISTPPLPDCAPPETLASYTAEFFIRPVDAMKTKNELTGKENPKDDSGSTVNGTVSPQSQQEVPVPAPNHAPSSPPLGSSPNAGSSSSAAIPAGAESPQPRSSALYSSSVLDNPGSQGPQLGTTNKNLEDNSRTKVRAKISILSQNIQPQRILSINANPCDTESTTPPKTLAANNTGDAAQEQQEPQEPQEPQITANDFECSIRAVLGDSNCAVQDLDAVEITGSPECFLFIQQTLREVLGTTPKERIKFSWDKLGDTDAGYREVFLKGRTSPTTQVLILNRHSDFSINLHYDGSTDEDSPNIVWYITGLGDKAPATTVKLVYRLYPFGYCDIDPVCTIIGPSDSTDQDTSADKTLVNHRKLDVRYSLIRSGSITTEDLLLGFVDTPTLWDKTGKQKALAPSVYVTVIEKACLFAFIPQMPCTICYFSLMQSSTMYEAHVAVTATLAIPFLLRLLQIINPWRQMRLVGYQEPVKLGISGFVSFLIAIPPLICSVHGWKPNTSAIVFLCIHVVSAAGFLVFTTFYTQLSRTDRSAYYGDYLELGAVLEAESYFPKLFADSDKPRQSKAEKACLEHYRRCGAMELLESYDTDKNQDFWREMGILHRIPYALMPGRDRFPDKLSLKCLRKDMTRAVAFKFVALRKRKLCDRLGISLADTDKQIKRRFSLIRDPDSKLLLIQH